MNAPKVIQTTHPTANDFNHHFDPKAYLQDLFSKPDDEDRFSISFITRMLRSLPDGLFIHEFGGGPTLYSVAALAPKACAIHFSDAVDASLREVEAWLQARPEAHDWDAYIALALEAEGRPVTTGAIESRAADMRQLVTQLMHCDAQAKYPIELKNQQYDLVSAHHCTDVASSNVEEWEEAIKNVTSIIRPDGWLILSVTTGASTYQVGEITFECANLTIPDIQSGLLGAGYQAESIVMETYQVEMQREYSGILSVMARLAA